MAGMPLTGNRRSIMVDRVMEMIMAAPAGMLRAVVCTVLKPNDWMIRPYCVPNPFWRFLVGSALPGKRTCGG